MEVGGGWLSQEMLQEPRREARPGLRSKRMGCGDRTRKTGHLPGWGEVACPVTDGGVPGAGWGKGGAVSDPPSWN